MELDSGEVVKVDDGLRNEAIIISDLFNCDEFVALELVITGNNYCPSFLAIRTILGFPVVQLPGPLILKLEMNK